MRGYNSTIIRKEKPCKVCGKNCFLFSHGRCEACARIENTMQRVSIASKNSIIEEDLSGLIDALDGFFSRYIRLKFSDSKGIVKCFTCNTFKHYTLMQNGHFIKRAHLYLRFDERNCKPQCPHCNENKQGNIPVYRERLEAEKPGLPDILREESIVVYKPTREELKQQITDYRKKVEELKKKLQ